MTKPFATFESEAAELSSQKARPKICVVILNWDEAELTMRCLDSVLRSDYPQLEVIVIDNGSQNGSADVIAAHYAGVVLLRNETNVGFAEGSNQGIRHAIQSGADYILLLNNDTVVDGRMVSFLLETAVAHGNCVAVSPKMYDGREPQRLWFVYGRTRLWMGIFSNPAYHAPATTRFAPLVPMQYVVGCCILIPRTIIEVAGDLDSRFFAYYEDVEWSIRVRRAGFGLVCDTRAQLWHRVASTGGKNLPRMRYLMTRNHIWTLRKHATRWQLMLFALVFYPPRCVFRLGKAAWSRNWKCIPAEFRGAMDGFFGEFCGAGPASKPYGLPQSDSSETVFSSPQ